MSEFFALARSGFLPRLTVIPGTVAAYRCRSSRSMMTDMIYDSTEGPMLGELMDRIGAVVFPELPSLLDE